MYVKIITHIRPHLDEIVAIWLLRDFGEEMFPGAATATIETWDSSSNTPDGRSSLEYEENGCILIGVGGGRFDEHAKKTRVRQKNECTATLVAKALGVDQDPALRKILKETLRNDTEGGAQLLEIPAVIKSMNAQGHSPVDVLDWAEIGLRAIYRQQKEFFDAVEEFPRVSEVEKIGAEGKILAVIRSDNEEMHKVARSKHGANASIVLQKKSSGNVQIFADKKSGVSLSDIAALLRLEEQEQKEKFLTTEWDALRSEGNVAGAEEWYYYPTAGFLFNGSLTAPNVKPTRVPFENIKRIIRIGVDSTVVNMLRQQTSRRFA